MTTKTTMYIYGTDTITASRLAALLARDDVDTDEGSQASVDYAMDHGAPETWSDEWSMSVTASEDAIAEIEAACDECPAVACYGREQEI